MIDFDEAVFTTRIIATVDDSMEQKYIIRVVGGNYTRISDMEEWVIETFGAKTAGWYNPRWSNTAYGVWHFKHEADATFFMLRWS